MQETENMWMQMSALMRHFNLTNLIDWTSIFTDKYISDPNVCIHSDMFHLEMLTCQVQSFMYHCIRRSNFIAPLISRSESNNAPHLLQSFVPSLKRQKNSFWGHRNKNINDLLIYEV